MFRAAPENSHLKRCVQQNDLWPNVGKLCEPLAKIRAAATDRHPVVAFERLRQAFGQKTGVGKWVSRPSAVFGKWSPEQG